MMIGIRPEVLLSTKTKEQDSGIVGRLVCVLECKCPKTQKLVRCLMSKTDWGNH